MLNQKLYTVADVAELTGLTDRTIRNYLKDGTLHGKKIGVQWRFTEEDINALFLETQSIENRTRTPEELISYFLNQNQKDENISCFAADFDLMAKQRADRDEISEWLSEQQKECSSKKELDLAYCMLEQTLILRIVIMGTISNVETMWTIIKKRIGS
ncbi:MAG: helix-turn-helix domain-containing protein [Lachnospiraceae bacterium]